MGYEYTAMVNVSIHAPHAGSDFITQTPLWYRHVSIHAPHAGSDTVRCQGRHGEHRFNPRSPRGERPRFHGSTDILCQFQSTLPTRGATRGTHPPALVSLCFNPRSPRGERRGILRRSVRRCFNPRYPRGERPLRRTRRHHAESVSIHAPHAGSDSDRSHLHGRRKVSIHAPHAGSDPLSCLGLVSVRFQSTLPTRGATHQPLRCSLRRVVSIHAPHAGSDHRCPIWAWCLSCFNPRSPRGERHKRGRIKYVYYAFQSTLPTRGATIVGDRT